MKGLPPVTLKFLGRLVGRVANPAECACWLGYPHPVCAACLALVRTPRPEVVW